MRVHRVRVDSLNCFLNKRDAVLIQVLYLYLDIFGGLLGAKDIPARGSNKL
jgi:hypothetical protein